MDRSALYGMVRSDKRKYGDTRLKAMLTKDRLFEGEVG